MLSSRCNCIRLGYCHQSQQVQVLIQCRPCSTPGWLTHHSPIGQHPLPLRQQRNARICRIEASGSSSAGSGSLDDDVPVPKRSSAIALPRFLNSPGAIFALAGLLKVLVVTLHTVPVGFSCPTGLAAASSMIPFGLALVLLSRYLLERDFMRWRWAAPVLVLGSLVLIWLNRTLLPARVPVQQKGNVNTAAEVRGARQETPVTRSNPPSTADAERLWDKYERAAEAKSKAAAAAVKAK